MSVDWDAIREEFPSLKKWTFLNTAAFGQLPRRAVEAAARHFTHRDELACSDFLEWFDDADRLRAMLARLIHASAADIAFVPNSATALSLLIGGLDWKPGDRVVTLLDEFPNNLYYPSMLASKGVEFVETSWAQLPSAITPNTRLVALSTVNYATGFRAPYEQIVPLLRKRGVLLYLDGTQSVGALKMDVSAEGPDMLAVHGYKWLLSPTGAGFMYLRPELRGKLAPNTVGWRSHFDWRNVNQLHHGKPEFVGDAEKYEGGMLSFPLLYAMEASVKMMLELDPSVIERRVLSLADQCRERLRKLGAEICSENSAIVTARLEGQDVSALALTLKQRGIQVSARHGNLRVSTHFYNNEADLEKLESELRSLTVAVQLP